MVWRLLARKCPNGRTLKSAAISGSLVVLAKTKIWRSWGSYFRLLLRRGTARGIEIVKRLQGLLLLEEFQPVSKQISGQHQHVYYYTPSLPSWSRPLIIEKFFFLCEFLPPPLIRHYFLRRIFLSVWILAAPSDTSPHCWHLSNCAGKVKTNLETETNETWHINTCINFILSHLTEFDDNDYMT